MRGAIQGLHLSPVLFALRGVCHPGKPGVYSAEDELGFYSRWMKVRITLVLVMVNSTNEALQGTQWQMVGGLFSYRPCTRFGLCEKQFCITVFARL